MIITLKRSGKCTDCGRELKAGTQAKWYKNGAVYCVDGHNGNGKAAGERPLVNPHATALKQDVQLRAQQAFDREQAKSKPLIPAKPPLPQGANGTYHWVYRREAVANLGKALEAAGWTLCGWHDDKSDSMTDYYDPESWSGIGQKGNAIVAVDIRTLKYMYGDAKGKAQNVNPKGKSWHVEVDGKIIGSGMGLGGCSAYNDHIEPEKSQVAAYIAWVVACVEAASRN